MIDTRDWSEARRETPEWRAGWLGGGARCDWQERVLRPLVETYGAHVVFRAWCESQAARVVGSPDEVAAALGDRCREIAANPETEDGRLSPWRGYLGRVHPDVLVRVTPAMLDQLEPLTAHPVDGAPWHCAANYRQAC